MTSEEDLAAAQRTLTQRWSQLGVEVEGLEELALRETTLATGAVTAPAELPPLLESLGTDTAPPFELGEVLGEGGMGVVLAAVQTAIGRTVAVKTLRADDVGAEHALQLLREGRITGLLEHPNVVPVHILGRDLTGRPIIVMKRIVGTPWSELLDAATDEERQQPAYLREHLTTLRQVAMALHFAHSEGVLHRDIKPDNVMIGAFGEVYLVDWGVAVSIAAEGVPHVPRARDVRRIEGTPVYMAPEMAAGAGDLFAPWTDVYLLGATLHHVITGAPPHEAEGIRAVLSRAFLSRPATYPEAVPEELRAVVRRAMAPDPEDRFPTAAAFAEAVEEHLLHGGSVELCEEGERRAAELEEADDVDTLFHEARFAFDQALRSWPGNERAARGRRALLERMVDVELGRNRPGVAQTLLQQHDDPPAALVEQVRARVDRLEQLERDADPAFGFAERLRRLNVSAAGFGVFCFTCGALTRYGIFPIDHVRFATLGTVFLAGSAISAMRWRRTTLANATNRQVAATSTIVFAMSMLLWPLLGSFGVSMPQATVVAAITNGCIWGTLVFPLGRGWLPMPLAHFCVAIGAWVAPAFHFEIFGLGALGMLLAGPAMVRELGYTER